MRRGTQRRGRTATRLAFAVAAAACTVPALALPASAAPTPTPTVPAAAAPTAAAHVTTPVPNGLAALIGGNLWGDDTTQEGQKASGSGVWKAASDLGSMWNTDQLVGAQSAWTQRDASGRPVTGKGVTVAVIDTGITPVAGLTGTGKIVNGPDLSYDSQADGTRYLDGFGHGTFMAGIIAGKDATGSLNSSSTFNGVAPDAQLLNMKVAASDGGADVTQVIAAIDWVIQHKRDNGMNVRVINLSYGTDSAQDYQADPLAKAVEDAWSAGIVVVAAAGNEGADSTGLTMPAADPYAIAVGASDHEGTNTALDDQVTDFTNPGTTARQADLLAPGKSVVSLRVPGSYVDNGHPEGLITGDASGRFFRGSGTSQATAVVSGVAALLLQDHPALTPDQVKQALVTSSSWIASQGLPQQGAGRVNAARALAVPTAVLTKKQTWQRSTGTGTLEAARGASHVVDPASGTALSGELDALGQPWDAAAWSAASTSGTAWKGGTFNGRQWAGDGWVGTSWAPAAWTGPSWTGLDWSSTRWSSDTWSSTRWSSDDWASRRWSGEDWSSTRWSSTRWSSGQWGATAAS